MVEERRWFRRTGGDREWSWQLSPGCGEQIVGSDYDEPLRPVHGAVKGLRRIGHRSSLTAEKTRYGLVHERAKSERGVKEGSGGEGSYLRGGR